jgi:transcriptional regulator with GAF, ATPase, and Fis domain
MEPGEYQTQRIRLTPARAWAPSPPPSGTLFRGEIDSLPLKLQVGLRRFLHPHEIVLLGGARARKLSVRLIAATSRNLADIAQTLHFRQDLHSRLNVSPLAVRPWRERCFPAPLILKYPHTMPSSMTRPTCAYQPHFVLTDEK